MVKLSLDLETQRFDDQTLIVSWNDTEQNALQTFFSIGLMGFVSLVWIVVGYRMDNLWIGTFAAVVVVVLMIQSHRFWPPLFNFLRDGLDTRCMIKNAVKFSRDTVVLQDGASVETSRISRFEYGSEAQLLGGQPNPQGGSKNVIRMWIDDSSAVSISTNRWQNQINHEIHTALTKALEAVRDIDKQQEHEQEFGKVSDDTGMPDY